MCSHTHTHTKGPASDYAIGANQGLGGALKWPVFKWSGGKDDAYFACLGKGIIKVFKTVDMRMLEPLKMDGVHVSGGHVGLASGVRVCVCVCSRLLCLGVCR